jgi:hypothetical protein
LVTCTSLIIIFFSKTGQFQCHIRTINVPGEKCIMHKLQWRKTRSHKFYAFIPGSLGRRTAMAFGEFGVLNRSALQKRTETEKGTRRIHTNTHIYSKYICIILYYTTRKSFQSSSCFFVVPVHVHNYQWTVVCVYHGWQKKWAVINVYTPNGKDHFFVKLNFQISIARPYITLCKV